MPSDSVKVNINSRDVLILVAVGAAGVGIYSLWDYFFKKEVFTISKPIATPQYIDAGETVTINTDITSESESTEKVEVKFWIRQGGDLFHQAGEVIETKSVTLTLAPGEIKTATITHVGTVGGPVHDGIAYRVVEIATLVDGKQMGKGRIDPDIFGVYFATDIVFGTPIISTPLNSMTGGVLDVFVGDDVIITTTITNNSDFDLVNFVSELTIGGVKVTGVPNNVPIGGIVTETFTWRSSGSQGIKGASHRILVGNSEIAGHDYGNVCYVIIPRILDLTFTGGGVEMRTPQNTPAPYYFYNGHYVFKDTTPLLLVASGTVVWTGDTDLGTTGLNPLPITMNRNRTIHAEIQSGQLLSFRVNLWNLSHGATYWSLLHYDQYGNMDFGSSPRTNNQSVVSNPVAAYGYFAINWWDENYNDLGWYVSEPFTIIPNTYDWFDYWDDIEQWQRHV